MHASLFNYPCECAQISMSGGWACVCVIACAFVEWPTYVCIIAFVCV